MAYSLPRSPGGISAFPLAAQSKSTHQYGAAKRRSARKIERAQPAGNRLVRLWNRT
jgi:hypothetical protein